jgi:DNA (cytosine-5)-methyltransferase 1
MLTCLDLFSGIGGIGLALKEYVVPIQYCEISKYCQLVLTERMEDGTLDKAPIHSDIKTLHISPAVSVEMLQGGSPCQDVSSMGLQKGIVHGEKSSMFFEMMRLVDENPSIQVLFLENVANITKCGLKEVIHEFERRGFDMQWTVRSASSLGAPHERKRWFCLGVRRTNGAQSVTATDEGEAAAPTGPEFGVLQSVIDKLPERGAPPPWAPEPKQRITFKPSVREDPTFDPSWISRCQCLGNSVVPVVVRESFLDLVSAYRYWKTMAVCLKDYGVPVYDLKYPYPETGLVVNGIFIGIPKMIRNDIKHNVSITLDVGEEEPWRMPNYPTPRRGLTHASTLTARSTRDLPSVLVHCEETKAYLREVAPEILEQGKDKLHQLIQCNVGYIEFCMGYAEGYTKIKSAVMPLSPGGGAGGDDDAAPPANGKKAKGRPKKVDGRTKRGRGEAAARGEGGGLEKAINSKKPSGAHNRTRINGMHLLMKEKDNVGKSVVAIAALWRSLSPEVRDEYLKKAAAQRGPASPPGDSADADAGDASGVEVEVSAE